MTANFYSMVATACLSASAVPAAAACNPALTEQFTNTQRIVDSLRPDKPGQIRVYASDGSEYTGAEALWMKGQLRAVFNACARGEEIAADSRLHGVVELLNSRHRTP